MVEIRKCSSKEEAGAIAELAREIWHAHYDSLIGKEQTEYMIEKYQSAPAIEEAIRRKGYVYFYACEGEDIVGYCGIHPQEEELFLSKLYVHKEYRGRGIARSLLNRAIQRAEQLGLQTIYLTVNKGNEGSIAAYEKMGFTMREAIVTDIGNGYVMDDYVMEKHIG